MWLAFTVTAVAALAALAMPWWWSRYAARHGLQRGDANIAAYRDRLRELESDAAAGVLPAEAMADTRAELDAHLVDDVTAARTDRLSDSRTVMPLLVTAIALLGFAATWYGAYGGWRTQALVALSERDPEAARTAALEQTVARLEQRTAEAPQDLEAWAWLGRSYLAQGRFDDAASAFARASAGKGGQDPGLLVEEGEALAYAQDRSLAGRPRERFEQALALAPEHPQALWYAGLAALQAGEVPRALAHWRRLRAQELPPEMREALDAGIAQLEAHAGVPARAPTVLTIQVRIAPQLAGEVRADDTVFVYALDPAGTRMPLAVRRLRAADLPARVTLDDSHAMVAGRTVSSVDRWRIVARISRSGAATPQPGDLQGEGSLERPHAAAPLALEISDRIP